MSNRDFRSFVGSIDLLKAFQNFPISSLFAIVATSAVILLIDNEDNGTLIRIAGACYLAFLTSLVTEVYRKSTSQLWVYVLPLIMCTIWFFYIPYDIDSTIDHEVSRVGYRFVSTAIILHLIISVIPFWGPSSEEDFWEFNKHLFLRIFESALFSVIIFLGLSMAIVALDQLFELDVDGAWYGRLLFFLGGIFNSLYFLSKFPEFDFDRKIDPPESAYKVFSEYILIGITSIYLLLLYAYAGKIFSEGELPRGWIGYLTIFFSLIGILSWLLNYFNPKFSNHRSTRIFVNHFFKFLTVPVAMLFVAIYTRIDEYGITEHRYIVAALATWLGFLTLTFGWVKKLHIKYIPITMAIVIAFSVFAGTMDMFDVSLRNQLSRLKSTLIESSVLENEQLKFDKLLTLDNTVKASIKSSISAISNRTDIEIINQWTTNDLFENYNGEESSKLFYLYDKLHLSDLPYQDGNQSTYTISFSGSQSLNVSGFTTIKEISLNENQDRTEDGIIIHQNELRYQGYDSKDVDHLVWRFKDEFVKPSPSEMTIRFKNEKDSSNIIIRSITVEMINDEIEIKWIDGWLLKN